MKARVVYVVNGSTQTRVLEAPRIAANIVPPKIGWIELRTEEGVVIKKLLLGECAEIEYLEL